MKAQVRGEFLSLEKWNFDDKSGWTLCLLQTDEVMRIGVQTEDIPQLKEWKKLDPVALDVSVRPGFNNKGFKTRFEGVITNGSVPAKPHSN